VEGWVPRWTAATELDGKVLEIAIPE